MPETQKKRPDKTTILIPSFNIDTIDLILYHAIPVAKVFDATLTFLFMGDDFAFNLFKGEIEKKTTIEQYENKIRLIHYSSQFIYTPVIEKNSEKEEAIMVIFPQFPSGKFLLFKEIRFMLKVKKLRLPYMILQSVKNEEQWSPKKIFLPIGLRRSDKETAVWASYFARFGNSEINILFAREENVISDKETKRNVKFIRNMFNKLNVTSNLIASQLNSGKLQSESVKLANEAGNSLVIISSTRYYGIEHLFTGPMELHTIKNPHKVPVLCINPRKDLYVLCK